MIARSTIDRLTIAALMLTATLPFAAITPAHAGTTQCAVQAEQLRTEAASANPFVDVSIQLKNPLSIVQGYLENLLDGMISDPVLLRQSLLTMRKHTLQIERVIDGLRR
jgi:signal transduction histidine kinase